MRNRDSVKVLKARCTLATAEEMARYDDCEIVSAEICDGQMDFGEDTEAFAKFTVVMKGTYFTIARWHSFGVDPRILRE